MKHRICGECRSSLRFTGSTTTIGRLVREGMEVSTSYCGYITKPGVSLPPPLSKFSNFRVAGPRDLHEGRRPGVYIWDKGKKTLLDPSDLDRLDRHIRNTPRIMLCGYAISGAYPIVSAINQYNIGKATWGRLYRKPKHTPDPRAYQAARRFLTQLLGDFLTPTQKMPFNEWLKTMRTGRQKKLQAAMNELELTGWIDEYGKFHLFCKSEKLEGHKRGPHGILLPVTELLDRLIQAPSDHSHCIAGPRMKPLVYKLKNQWNPGNNIFYASVSADVLQAWTDRVQPRGRTGVCVDYSMFDSTHSSLSWRLIEHIYNLAGIVDLDLSKVLNAWRAPRGSATGMGWALWYISYVLNASGRDDTALVNALLNGIVIFLSLAASHFRTQVHELDGTHVAWALDNVHIAIVGDDSLAYIPPLRDGHAQEFADRLSANIGLFGLDADGHKIQITDDVHEQVFLGMRLYSVGEGLLWGKTLGRALYKGGWQCAPFSADGGAWMAGEALMTTITQAHVPILCDLAESYLAWWGSGKVTRPKDDPDKPWHQSGPRPRYDDRTVYQVCRTYDITTAEFDSLISLIRSINQYPIVIKHGVLTRLLYHDLQ